MRKTCKLENLDCANCAAKIEHAIKEIEGVKNASVNFMMQSMTIETEEDIESVLRQVKKVIAKIEPDCEIAE